MGPRPKGTCPKGRGSARKGLASKKPRHMRVPQRSQCLPSAPAATLHQGWGCRHGGLLPRGSEKTPLFIVLKSLLASHIPLVSEPFSHLPLEHLSSLSAYSHPQARPQPLLGIALGL